MKTARTGDAESGIAPIFDKERVKDEVDAQVHITKAFGQQASKAIGDYAGKKYNELKDTDPEEAAKWAEGGTYRVAAHTLVGGLSGGAGGAAGAGLASLSANTLNEFTADMPDGVRQLVGAGLAAGIGVIAAGTAGAAAAFNADVNNRQLHPGDRELARDLARKSAGKYSVQQIEEQMRLMGTRDKVWFEGLYSQGEGGEVSFAQYKLAVQTYVRFLADPEGKTIEVAFPDR